MDEFHVIKKNHTTIQSLYVEDKYTDNWLDSKLKKESDVMVNPDSANMMVEKLMNVNTNLDNEKAEGYRYYGDKAY